MSVPHLYPDVLGEDKDWLSECCAWHSLGELFRWLELQQGGDYKPMASGRCAKCGEMSNFTREETKTTTKGTA